jgi:hypothetical protein
LALHATRALAETEQQITRSLIGRPLWRRDYPEIGVMWPSTRAGGDNASNTGIALVAFDCEHGLRSRESIISWLTPTPHAPAVYVLAASLRLAKALAGTNGL